MPVARLHWRSVDELPGDSDAHLRDQVLPHLAVPFRSCQPENVGCASDTSCEMCIRSV